MALSSEIQSPLTVGRGVSNFNTLQLQKWHTCIRPGDSSLLASDWGSLPRTPLSPTRGQLAVSRPTGHVVCLVSLAINRLDNGQTGTNALDRRFKSGRRHLNHPHSRRVRTIPADAPTAFAISRKLAPSSRSRVISSLLTIRRGRPNVFPLSLALRSPARTRS
jgi:hypothetical protein